MYSMPRKASMAPFHSSLLPRCKSSDVFNMEKWQNPGSFKGLLGSKIHGTDDMKGKWKIRGRAPTRKEEGR